MRYTLSYIVLVIASLFFLQSSVSALSLKISPQEYRTQLAKGEKKKGIIDVSNPTSRSVIVRTSVEAFRQTDNNGSLKFYKNEQVSAGIQTDLDEFELGPREAVRMYFLIDGTKLPTGDVYAAVFFTTEQANTAPGVDQSVRLGTLLSIINETPGPRDAQITQLDVPWFHFDTSIKGSYTIKNTADPQNATGFYPDISLKAMMFGEEKKQAGKLVFAGRSRQADFTLNTLPFGVYKVSASYENSSVSRWAIVMSPLALIVIIVAVVVIIITVHRFRKKRRTVTPVATGNPRL